MLREPMCLLDAPVGDPPYKVPVWYVSLCNIIFVSLFNGSWPYCRRRFSSFGHATVAEALVEGLTHIYICDTLEALDGSYTCGLERPLGKTVAAACQALL